MSASRAEQETTVTHGRDEKTVHIWSNNPVHLRRLRGDARVTETKEGFFTVPAEAFDALKGFRRAKRSMTPEQRTAAAARLAQARGTRP